MTIPVATTTIRVDQGTETEPGEGLSWTSTAFGIRAHIGTPTGNDQLRAGGGRETIDAVLHADSVSLAHTDRVYDETTGEVWQVVWVQPRQGLGLDHTHAGLRRVTGVI